MNKQKKQRKEKKNGMWHRNFKDDTRELGWREEPNRAGQRAATGAQTRKRLRKREREREPEISR